MTPDDSAPSLDAAVRRLRSIVSDYGVGITSREAEKDLDTVLAALAEAQADAPRLNFLLHENDVQPTVKATGFVMHNREDVDLAMAAQARRATG